MAGVDSPVPVRVVARNAGQLRPAVLNLYLDGAIADSSAVELQPGRSAMTFASRLTNEGSHRLRAELRAEGDGQPANNARDVGITLRDPTRALVLTTRPHSVIATALAREDVRAACCRRNAVRGIDALLRLSSRRARGRHRGGSAPADARRHRALSARVRRRPADRRRRRDVRRRRLRHDAAASDCCR